MRQRSDLFGYQQNMISRMLVWPQTAAFVQMGLGKTIGTLTALLDRGMPRTLVVAPARVAELDVWGQEARRWGHTAGLHVRRIVGDPKTRRWKLADVSTDIDVISYNNFAWLCDEVDLGQRYGAIVFDELSKMKTPGATWFKRMRTRTPRIPIRYGLTGTPVGNHLIDVWGEMYAVALDEPLGPSKVQYAMQYFTAIPVNEHARMWVPNYGAEELIFKRIRPWCFSLNPGDAPPLPGVVPNPISVELPAEVRRLGDELTHELRARLASGEDLVAISSGTRAQKFRQLAGGAVYLDEERWEEVHGAKLAALGEVLDELQGQPVLIGYWYRHERERILREFPQVRELNALNVELWNQGKVEAMLIHPASAGHGINLQGGGHNITWFTVPWSWEMYSQTCARLARHGQRSRFVMSHVLCAGAADVAVLQALHEKKWTDQRLKDYVEV